jgi:hypothetical protein
MIDPGMSAAASPYPGFGTFRQDVFRQVSDTLASGISEEKYYGPQRADRRSKPE